MNSFRNLYGVFRETRRAAREQATVAVMGDSAVANDLARAMNAQTDMRGAEIMIQVAPDGESAQLYGKAVDDPGDIDLSGAEYVTNENGYATGKLPKQIVDALDDNYRVPLAKGYPFFRRAVCEDLIYKNARQNAFIGAIPIPGADMPAMTANQGRMVLLIAAAHGEELSFQRARELLGVLAAGFGLRALTRQVIKVIPVGGWLAAAAVGYAGTVAMGRATMLYFERGGQQVGANEMEAIRERATREAQNFVTRIRNRGK